MEVKFQFTSPENEALLRILSNVPKTRPKIKLDITTNSGSWIYAKIRYTNKPVKQSSGTYLIVPFDPNVPVHRKFLYFNVEDHVQINRYLKATFRSYFLQYFVTCKMAFIPNKFIIAEFINLINLNHEHSLYEKLIKYEYREREKIRQKLPIGFLESKR